MKIAVFGWYGHHNAGDERIKYSLNHFLMGVGGIDCVDFYDLHDNAVKGTTSQFDDYDLVIIGGGGIIYSQYNYHDFIRGINTRMITAGVSVEAELTGNRLLFSRALLDRCDRFLVRDHASFEKLTPFDSRGILKKSSDLTFLQPFDVCSNQKEVVGVNFQAKLRPGFINNNYLRSRLSGRFPIIQPRTYDMGCNAKYLKTINKIKPIPLYTAKIDSPLEYMKNDSEFMRIYFESVPCIFNDADMDDCHVFISMRLHGLIFAIQKGIPFLGYDIYPKQVNLAAEAGVADAIVQVSQPRSLPVKFDMFVNNKNEMRDKILSYREKACTIIKNDILEILNWSI